MKRKKIGFFRRVKKAIINFDEYKALADEKLWTTIKYVLRLTLIFAIIVSVSLLYRTQEEINNVIKIYQEECPNFRFENNTLLIDDENKQFIKGDESGYFAIVVDSEQESLKKIKEIPNYEVVLLILKDKMVMRNHEGQETTITYQQVSNKYDINKINKQELLNVATSSQVSELIMSSVGVIGIYLYITFLIQILLDILLISVVGYLLSRIIGVKFKYKSIFNMSAYALTLSVVLYMIYLSANILTGFTIKYFEIAYNAIAYIYIITAMLMIKSDLIKQQIEVGEIVEEQKKVREEKEQENKEMEKEEKPKKEKKEKKEKNKEEGTPEGNEA